MRKGRARIDAALAARPPLWAEPLERRGVPNLHRVDTNFFRSAQPSRTGFTTLVNELGLRTTVSLRLFHSDEDLVQDLGIAAQRFPIRTWSIREETVIAPLTAIRTAQRLGPVLLHCQHGADRTGLVSALYRVLFQGWSKQDALREMKEGRFGYHAIWGNIPAFLERVDVAALRAAIEAP